MPNRSATALQFVRFVSLYLGCAVLTAQSLPVAAPVVPLDHYGPPLCEAAPRTVETRPIKGEAPQAARSKVEAAGALEEAGASDPTAILPADPLGNFDVARYRLADYDDCVGLGGCYWADLDAQYKRAEAAFDRLVASRKAGEKLALVMDIDETSLSGYCEMKREDYGYIRAMSDEWIVSPAAAVAIPGGVRLFNRARSAGVDVFFITGRPERQAEATARNLRAAGYQGWSGLALRHGAEASMPTIQYKAGRRAQIVAQGYRIVMNIGDQWSDLSGAPKAEVSVKLPNPFYFLP